MADTITVKNFDYYVNDTLAVKASITRRKGRGKEHTVWQGKPWEVVLCAFKLGIVINSNTVWKVILTLADGKTAMFDYDTFLKAR